MFFFVHILYNLQYFILIICYFLNVINDMVMIFIYKKET
jgi:hypothetical protein